MARTGSLCDLPSRCRWLSILVLSPIAGFTLMPDGKNQDSPLILFETIEGYVTRPTARYHQFPQIMLDGTTDERMAFQQRNGFPNQPYRFSRCRRISLKQEVGQSFKIGKRPFRITQLRQDLAFGFADFLPAMRAVR